MLKRLFLTRRSTKGWSNGRKECQIPRRHTLSEKYLTVKYFMFNILHSTLTFMLRCLPVGRRCQNGCTVCEPSFQMFIFSFSLAGYLEATGDVQRIQVEEASAYTTRRITLNSERSRVIH